jgi:O-antigen ligase
LDAFVQKADPFEEARIFNGSAALLLGQAALIALQKCFRRPNGGRTWNAVCFLVFFATVLISNQRTATFATIAGAITIFALVPRQRITTIACGALIFCAAGLAVLALASFSDGQLTEYLPRSLQMIVLQEGTFGWRLDQWQIYFQQWVDATPLDQIVGQPFGVARAIGLRFSTLTELDPLALPAHSEYLQFLLNVGVLGLLIFIMAILFALIDAIGVLKGYQGRSSLGALAVAILVSQLVFSFSYSLDNEQGLLLAISVQIIGVAREACNRLHAAQRGRTPMPVRLYMDHRQSFGGRP